jgi:hypothetical protein
MLGQIAQILDPIAPMRDAGAVARSRAKNPA